MSKLSDEQLLKRSKHAGRNLFVLAILATVGAVALAAIPGKPVLPLMLMLSATLSLIAAGYWVLAVAARRGSAVAVGIVLVVMTLQLFVTLVTSGLAAVRHDHDAQPNVVGLIVFALVMVALVSSRNVLIELKKRDLWNGVFGSAPSSRSLCVVGGILLVLGFVGFDAGAVLAGRQIAKARAQEIRHTQAFVRLVKEEEQTFLNAVVGLADGYDTAEIVAALTKVNALEQKLAEIQAAVPGSGPLSSILTTYANAIRQWKNGLTEMNKTVPDQDIAMKKLKLGDKLRADAGREFDRRYAKKD